jgi:xanthine dehydrogenase YagR molybdenum-binding subunit
MKGDIGKPISRLDARAKVTGTATYAAETEVANIAHAVIVGSPIARGMITLDTNAASRQPGVLRVLSAGNAPTIAAYERDMKKGDKQLQLLQDDRVWYVDQPIAVVVADTLERAQHAAASIAIKADIAAVQADLSRSLDKAFDAEQMGPNGSATSNRGNIDAGIAAAAVHVDHEYQTQIQHHNAMEPHATVAVWQGDTKLTIYDSTQGIFNVRGVVAKAFGLPLENVRVINHYLGGGFGSKGSPWSHVVLAAMAARAVGRPVKLVVTRQQMFGFVGYRPTTIQRVALGADREGRLTAIRHDTIAECCRFDRFVEPSGLQSRHLYRCPNVATSHKLVELDVATPTFTRGPGITSGTFALECAMDELAYELELDPLELRLRNHATRDDHENKPYSAKSLLECYKRAAKKFGWAKRNAKPRSQRDGNELVGWGMASVTYPAKQRPASARARMKADGTLVVQAGTQEIGTGTYTIMTQIAADTLDVPLDKVVFELGDTVLPETPLSAGSLTAASTGSAVKDVCDKLRAQLEQLRKDAGESWASVVQRSGKPEIVVDSKTELTQKHEEHSCNSFGACFVELRVEPVLGRIRVARIVASYAAGTILNPKTARSQYIGGLIWGIGFALTEKSVRDARSGRIVTRDLADYHVPVHADMPAFEIIQVPEDDPNMNELGVKGIGEIGMSGIAAAIANALFHATGKRIRELPITLDKVLV